MKTLWIMDQEWILAWILDSVCIVVQTWGLKQGLDHSSFVSFGQFVNVSSKFCFFKQGSFVLSCEVVFEWSAVFFVIEHFAFFTICVILTNAFTFTSFPMNFCLFSVVVMVLDWLKLLTDQQIWGKRLTSAVLCTPFTPSCCNLQQKNVIESHLLAEEGCNSNQASCYSFSAIDNIFSSAF